MSNNLINFENQALESISAEQVAGYRIVRSFFNNTLVNVHAVDKNNDLLVCISPDMQLDKATALVEVLNAPYELDEIDYLQETELVHVEVAKQERIFTAVKGKVAEFQ